MPTCSRICERGLVDQLEALLVQDLVDRDRALQHRQRRGSRSRSAPAPCRPPAPPPSRAVAAMTSLTPACCAIAPRARPSCAPEHSGFRPRRTMAWPTVEARISDIAMVVAGLAWPRSPLLRRLCRQAARRGHGSSERLAVASYNVQFATPELPLAGPAAARAARATSRTSRRAPRRSAAALACFDVIALQETINDRRRGELLAALETPWPRLAASPRAWPRARCSRR